MNEESNFFQLISEILLGPRPLSYEIILKKILIDVIANRSFSQSMFLPVNVLG
jgi:hypothetical protein